MNNFSKMVMFGAVSAAIFSGNCAAAERSGQPGDKTAVPAEVSEIAVEAGNRVSITFVKDADSVFVSEVRSQAVAPVTVERQGARLLVKVAGDPSADKPGEGKMYTSLKLHLPPGRKLAVLGKNLVLSGEMHAAAAEVRAASLSMHFLKISASELTVDSAYASLKFSLAGAKKLSITSENLSGRVTVPAGAKVSCPEAAGFQIVRAGK